MSLKDGKDALQSALQFILSDERYAHFSEQVKMIQTRLREAIVVTPNIEGVSKVLSQAQSYLGRIQSVYREEANQIRDWDRFLDTIQHEVLVTTAETTEPVVFSAPLFLTDQGTKKLLSTQESPTKSYLALNKVLVDGFYHALSTKTPTELNLSPLVHEAKL